MPGPVIGYATLQVIPSLRGLDASISRQLGGLGSLGRNVGQDFSRSFASSLTTGVAGAVAAVAAATAAAFAVVAKTGIQAAAANESAAVSFEVLLGSAEKAKSFMEELREFAQTTPFEFSELQGTASQLLAVGIAAKDIVPILTSLGNSTAAMGTGSDGIRRAVVALQQMNSAQKITAQDLNQLREAGVPVFELLANATGKTTREISKMREAGELGRRELDLLMASLVSGEGLERFDGLLQKQSKTFEGMISNLKDITTQQLAGLFTPMLEGFKGLLPAITPAIDRLGTAATGILDPLVEQGLPVLEKFASLGVGFLEDYLQGYSDILPAVLDLADGLANALGPVLGETGELFKAMAAEIGPELEPLFATFSDVLSENAVAIADLIGSFASLAPAAADLLNAVAPMLEVLLRLTTPAMVAGLEAFASGVEAIAGPAKTAAGFVGALVSPLAVLADALDRKPSGDGDAGISVALSKARLLASTAAITTTVMAGLNKEITRPPSAGPTALEDMLGNISQALKLTAVQRDLASSFRELAEAQATAAGRGKVIADLQAAAAEQRQNDLEAIRDAEEAAAEAVAAAQERVQAAVDAVAHARADDVEAAAESEAAQRSLEEALVAVAEAYDKARERIKLLREEQLPLSENTVERAQEAIAQAEADLREIQYQGDDPFTASNEVTEAQRQLEEAQIRLAQAEREHAEVAQEVADAEASNYSSTTEVTSAVEGLETAQDNVAAAEERRLGTIAAIDDALAAQAQAERDAATAAEEAQKRISDAHADAASNAATAAQGIKDAIDGAIAKLGDLELAAKNSAVATAEYMSQINAPVGEIALALGVAEDFVKPGTPIYEWLQQLKATLSAAGSDRTGGGYGFAYPNRMGGLYSFASGGVTPAHIGRGTLFKWAEPQTGGEAFIPRLGNLFRSESILRHVASDWFGGRYLSAKEMDKRPAWPMRSFEWGGVVDHGGGSGRRGGGVVIETQVNNFPQTDPATAVALWERKTYERAR